MASLDGDFDIDVKRHYRVEAGQDLSLIHI